MHTGYYHEILKDGALGVRTLGIAIFRNTAGNNVAESLTMEDCRRRGFWPEMRGTEAPQPNRYSDIVETFRKIDGSETVERDVSWRAWTDIDQIARDKVAQIEGHRSRSIDGGVTLTVAAGEVASRSDPGALAEYNGIEASSYPGVTQFSILDLWNGVFIVAKSEVQGMITTLVTHRLAANGNYATKLGEVSDLHGAGNVQGLIDYDTSTGWPDNPTQPAPAGEPAGEPEARRLIPEVVRPVANGGG